MNVERHRRIGDLYHRALAVQPSQRLDFLKSTCNGDVQLFHEVETLLAAHEEADDFITTPAFDIAAQAIAEEARGEKTASPRFSRLGPYEVVSVLGSGGMGEVYRGRDARLGRDVALKILPERLALDVEHRARFEREARVLASLNHPNIAALYGVEQIDGRQVLVMELVEGMLLEHRIASGPIPLGEVAAIGRQIAEALEAAHDQGFVHRDLKPANVAIRPDGTVKVLDFGLAKAISPPGGGDAPAHITARSGLPVVLGTASYMSPEQARGAPVDRRTDIWSFGCVLYEMITGRKAFGGESASDVIAKIIGQDPPLDTLPATMPASMRRLLHRCLQKNVRERLRHIGDAILELNDTLAGGSSPEAASSGSRLVMRPAWRWVALSALLVQVASVLWWFGRESKPPASVSRFAVAMPPAAPLVTQLGPSVAISNDGLRLAVRSNGGMWGIRRRDALGVSLIGGDDIYLTMPFFSPDGQWLGFADGANSIVMLKRVPARGGTAVLITDVSPAMFGATWGADDMIVFATAAGLSRVAAGGGTPELLLAADRRHEEVFSWPQFLPGNRWLLFTLTGRGTALPGPYGEGSLMALEVSTGRRRTILPGVTRARYLPTGHLVYTAGGALYAVRFDGGSLDVLGDAVPVIRDVLDADFAVSDEGTLAYVAGSQERTLVWVDRQGREEPVPVPPRRYIYARLSPDGTKVAVDLNGPDRNIWVLDLRQANFTRLTFDPAEDLLPIWTPDGARIAFSRRVGVARLYWQAADGSGTATLLNEATTSQMPAFFTPDGKQLVFNEQQRDYLTLTLDGSRRIDPLLTSGATEINADLSPDGRWVAFSSNETGQFDIFVRPFPEVSRGKWQISRGGGAQALWSRDGRELYYRDAAGALWAVPVQLAPSFVHGPPVKLFEGTSYAGRGNLIGGRTYDVSPDSQRFLMIKVPPRQPDQLPVNSLVVVQNWFEELNRLAPAR